jgi:hypothetical protein
MKFAGLFRLWAGMCFTQAFYFVLHLHIELCLFTRQNSKCRCSPAYEQITILVNIIHSKFNVLLTVHHAVILGKWPTWRTNSFQCIYLFTTLYMFRSRRAHHQERQIVLIQLLVTVTPCCWQCSVLVGTLFPTSTRHCHQHGVTVTRSCINKTCLSWWWARRARNM